VRNQLTLQIEGFAARYVHSAGRAAIPDHDETCGTACCEEGMSRRLLKFAAALGDDYATC
jgi:hypothetical protein